jgi:hypothetical protein
MAKRLKTGGRRPGSVNKITRSFREALHRAFENIGGVEALTEWAKANPGEFFKICARLIPVEICAPNGSGITVVVNRGGTLMEEPPALIEQGQSAAAALLGPAADG